MATDSAKPVDLPPRPALAAAARSGRALPRVLSIDVRRGEKPARVMRHMSTPSPAAGLARTDGVEFVVKLGDPVPARALGPALFIGDVQIAESQAIDERTIRFFIADDPRLKLGERIFFGWINDRPEDRIATPFTYEGAK